MRVSRSFSRAVLFSFLLGSLFGGGITGIGAGMKGSAVFKDIRDGAAYDEAVGELYGAGILTGKDDGSYHPDDPVTRGELALILKKLRNEMGGSGNDGEANGNAERSVRKKKAVKGKKKGKAKKEEQEAAPPPTPAAPATDPSAGSIHFIVEKFAMPESSPKATMSVMRTGGSKGSVSVHYKLVEDTAKAESDFQVSEGDLIFENKETQKSITFYFRNDTEGEAPETFKVVLSDPTGGASLGSPASATVTILDNDGGPAAGGSASSAASASVGGSAAATGGAFEFSAPTYGILENGSSITVTVKRMGGTAAASVNFATADGLASAGTDYTAAQGTLSFAANEATKTFTVAVADNATIDGNRTVNLLLSNPTGGTIGSQKLAVLTIIDNETNQQETGTVQFNSTVYSTTEGAGSVTVSVTRSSGDLTKTVSVNYATSDGSATTASDFTALSGTLTFAPGETSRTIAVAIIKDAQSEGDETIGLELKDPVGVSLGGNNNATIKILGQ